MIRSRLTELRQQTEKIRKSRGVPYWRLSYAEFMLQRADEYLLVDRHPEAQMVCDRLQNWLEKNAPAADARVGIQNPKIVFWTSPFLKKIILDLRSILSSKKQLIPAPERDSFFRRLEKIEGWVDEGRFLKAREDLLAVRLGLIARLKRSYRARALSSNLKTKADRDSSPSTSMIGLYNAQHTLENTFYLIGERDPIWVEDFLETYNNLFKYVERLAPKDKKKK